MSSRFVAATESHSELWHSQVLLLEGHLALIFHGVSVL